jgi:2-polyprenyl-3-methyl-5-hydroxy-6-metoxy-1,4-benzoquinol methylase
MYEGYGSPERDFYFESFGEEVTAHFDSYLKRCHEYRRANAGGLHLLDIGCGNGSFLARAKKQGFVCEGIEACEALAGAVRNKLDCPVHNTLLSECDFPAESFDIVTMYDLVEHLQDPIRDIRRVHSWLKPGGILFLLTPNDNALFRRLTRTAFRWSFHVAQRPMRALYYPHHLSYFTSRSLGALLEDAGFQIVDMETQNQEVSRLHLSRTDRVAVRLIFEISKRFRWSGGKLLAWARRREI